MTVTSENVSVSLKVHLSLSLLSLLFSLQLYLFLCHFLYHFPCPSHSLIPLSIHLCLKYSLSFLSKLPLCPSLSNPLFFVFPLSVALFLPSVLLSLPSPTNCIYFCVPLSLSLSLILSLSLSLLFMTSNVYIDNPSIFQTTYFQQTFTCFVGSQSLIELYVWNLPCSEPIRNALAIAAITTNPAPNTKQWWD